MVNQGLPEESLKVFDFVNDGTSDEVKPEDIIVYEAHGLWNIRDLDRHVY